MTAVLTFYSRVSRAIVQHFCLHSDLRDVWFAEDNRVGRCLLHEKVLVYVDVPDSYTDVRASPVQLFYGSCSRAYFSPMVGVDRRVPLFVEVHGHQINFRPVAD